MVKIIDELKGKSILAQIRSDQLAADSKSLILIANGHEVVLFSNIGEEHLEKLVERLPVMVRAE